MAEIGSKESDKSCRSCTDFRSWMKKQKSAQNDLGCFQSSSIHSEKTSSDISSNKTDHVSAENQFNVDDDILWGKAAKEGCPADSLSLGRGTWRLLHTIAANYSDSPSVSEQNDMKLFISLFSRIYPCPPCARDFQDWLEKYPPDVSSSHELSQFFCRAHNEVNRKLGKPEFDCKFVDERWKHGWSDGSCG